MMTMLHDVRRDVTESNMKVGSKGIIDEEEGEVETKGGQNGNVRERRKL
jgi:hypothetical protein